MTRQHILYMVGKVPIYALGTHHYIGIPRLTRLYNIVLIISVHKNYL